MTMKGKRSRVVRFLPLLPLVASLVGAIVVIGVPKVRMVRRVEGERQYVAGVLGISTRDVLPLVPDVPEGGLKAKVKSGTVTVLYTFGLEDGRVDSVAPVNAPGEHSAMEPPATTAQDRADAVIRAATDYLGATQAAVLPLEGKDAVSEKYHVLFVDVQGEKTRLAPRYLVRFGPDGKIIALLAERRDSDWRDPNPGGLRTPARR